MAPRTWWDIIGSRENRNSCRDSNGSVSRGTSDRAVGCVRAEYNLRRCDGKTGVDVSPWQARSLVDDAIALRLRSALGVDEPVTHEKVPCVRRYCSQ